MRVVVDYTVGLAIVVVHLAWMAWREQQQET